MAQVVLNAGPDLVTALPLGSALGLDMLDGVVIGLLPLNDTCYEARPDVVHPSHILVEEPPDTDQLDNLPELGCSELLLRQLLPPHLVLLRLTDLL